VTLYGERKGGIPPVETSLQCHLFSRGQPANSG